MHEPIRTARRFSRDRRGATAIEYALIAGMIGAAIAVTVFTLGGSVLTDQYQRLLDEMSLHTPTVGGGDGTSTD